MSELTSKEVAKFIRHLESRVKDLEMLVRNTDKKNQKLILYDHIQAVKKEIKILRQMR